MNHVPLIPWRGLWRHLWLTLRLNFRSRQPLIYGYLVPVFFLFGFGSVFRTSDPPLLREMGQLLTITVLGSACFGMPTATVAERERGIWRCYRLLPASTLGIAMSTVIARFVLILTAVGLQVILARVIYGTPWPAQPAPFLAALAAAAFAFLGLGWLIAMLADNVPAVQALGQAVFLPMIMIGGVGVPLRTLPQWAQHVAAFLPGRYAVEALDACILPQGAGLVGAKFALAALGIVGAAAFVAAAGLFRWQAGPRPLDWRARGWIVLALAAWAGVGIAAVAKRPSESAARSPVASQTRRSAQPWRALTETQLADIRFDGLTPDNGYVVPLVPDYDNLGTDDRKRLDLIQDRLAYWQPGTVDDASQRVRNLLSVCAAADLVMDPAEGEIARAVFDQIKDAVRDPIERQQVLVWIVQHPDDGEVVTDSSEFGIAQGAQAQFIRERVAAYARKLMRELRGAPAR